MVLTFQSESLHGNAMLRFCTFDDGMMAGAGSEKVDVEETGADICDVVADKDDWFGDDEVAWTVEDKVIFCEVIGIEGCNTVDC